MAGSAQLATPFPQCQVKIGRKRAVDIRRTAPMDLAEPAWAGLFSDAVAVLDESFRVRTLRSGVVSIDTHFHDDDLAVLTDAIEECLANRTSTAVPARAQVDGQWTAGWATL